MVIVHLRSPVGTIMPSLMSMSCRFARAQCGSWPHHLGSRSFGSIDQQRNVVNLLQILPPRVSLLVGIAPQRGVCTREPNGTRPLSQLTAVPAMCQAQRGVCTREWTCCARSRTGGRFHDRTALQVQQPSCPATWSGSEVDVGGRRGSADEAAIDTDMMATIC